MCDTCSEMQNNESWALCLREMRKLVLRFPAWFTKQVRLDVLYAVRDVEAGKSILDAFKNDPGDGPLDAVRQAAILGHVRFHAPSFRDLRCVPRVIPLPLEEP